MALNVLGIAGSLRRRSFNKYALDAALELRPDGMEIEVFDLAPIPLYNEDVRAAGFPAPVQALRDAIARADALLIATPEYNYSVPGVLKNAIDWASRQPEQPFNDKPVAVMGASSSWLGTARAQYHLRQSFVFLNALPLNRPEVRIADANTRFDEQGRLTDEKTRELIARLLMSLRDWTLRLRGDA